MDEIVEPLEHQAFPDGTSVRQAVTALKPSCYNIMFIDKEHTKLVCGVARDSKGKYFLAGPRFEYDLDYIGIAGHVHMQHYVMYGLVQEYNESCSLSGERIFECSTVQDVLDTLQALFVEAGTNNPK